MSSAVRDAKTELAPRAAQLCLLFASPRHDLAEAIAEARKLLPRVDVVGCSSAGEITERGLCRGGVSVMLVAWGEARHLVAVAGPPHDDVPALAEALGGRFVRHTPDRSKYATLFVFGDGLSPAFEKLVIELRKSPRHHHPIVGAGAGDDGRFERTAVGVNDRVFSGGMASVEIESDHAFGVGVAHGLERATRPMTVTRARGNHVFEIDERPALDVYREYASSIGVDLAKIDVPQFMVENELGVLLFDEVVRVRAALRVEKDGSLYVAGEVPEGSSVCIVRGTEEQIIAAASIAAEDAKASLGSVQPAGILVFSCVCRGRVLGERYAEEIRAIQSVFPDVPICGLSSYGEVARTRSRLDGYHNDTIVVVAIPE
ncbi:MAG: FIST N-terminal domain-containing protein [Polyangiaceae bacterium]